MCEFLVNYEIGVMFTAEGEAACSGINRTGNST